MQRLRHQRDALVHNVSWHARGQLWGIDESGLYKQLVANQPACLQKAGPSTAL